MTEARLSGPSRLVFAPRNNGPTSIPFTVDGLTNWTNLDLVVAARALPPDASVEDQLKLIGISQHASIGEKLFKIATSLLPPGPAETALEMPYRLLLSPASTARWLPLMTRRDPHRPHAPWTLWHTRLIRKKVPIRSGQYGRRISILGFSTAAIIPRIRLTCHGRTRKARGSPRRCACRWTSATVMNWC